MKRFTPIYVEWVDAGGLNNDGWHDVDIKKNEPPITLCKSLGFYLESTKHYIYLCQNFDSVDPTAATNIERIPHGCIQKIRKITLPKG